MSAVILVLLLTASGVVASSSSDTFVGRRLEDALRILQARGLRVVFTSQMVTPQMRVSVEPKARIPRDQLDELLAPHDLVAKAGPGGVLQVVRRTATPQPAPAARNPVQRSPVAPPASVVEGGIHGTYREQVTVAAASPVVDNVGGPSRTLGAQTIGEFGGHIADDPLRVVQVLPGVAVGDDFRSEISVRGSAYRHAGLVIDGVAAPWLRHQGFGERYAGSLSMLRADMVTDLTLHVGAYPRRDSGQLGPQLNLTLREGSRTARHVRIGVSGSSATLAAEGPLGSSTRGSWIVGLRQSNVEWPIGRDDHQTPVFAYADLQSKVVYDVSPEHQVSFSVVAGRSNIELEYANSLPVSSGVNESALATLAWRSVFGGATVVTQRASVQTQRFLDRDTSTRTLSHATDGALGYRMDVTHALGRGVVDAGAQIGRRRDAEYELTAFDTVASWLERSTYVSLRQHVAREVAVDAGLRLADSTLVKRGAIDRWLLLEWSPRSVWRVHASTGVMHQLPELERVHETTIPSALRPERAVYADVGIAQRLSRSVRWNMTLFARRESDVLRAQPFQAAASDSNDQWYAPNPSRIENSLTGTARGLEVSVQRLANTGLSGWIGYSFGVARYHDISRGESFNADLDQRHSVVASGTTRIPGNMRVGVTARAGTNFPIPGYFTYKDSRLFLTDQPNRVRLPAYVRLDVRAERMFARRFTVFVEAINVSNRVNVGPSDGVVMRDTSEGIGFTERLFPRLVTGGVRLDFGYRPQPQ